MDTTNPRVDKGPDGAGDLNRQPAPSNSWGHGGTPPPEALGAQEAVYRSLFELMPGSVVLLDPKGFVRDANPFFCQYMGFAREEIVGKHVSQFSQEPPEVIQENIHRMLSGEVLEHEVTNVQKDGTRRFYELREAAITLPDGSKAILAVSNDLTDRRRAEQAKLEMERKLLRIQKLESLGVLAGGIAHDFNNLLAAMQGNIELAILDSPPDSLAKKSLKLALAAGQRAASLIQQMLDYAGRGHSVRSEVNLTHLVAELAELLKDSISKSARLGLRLAKDLPPIRADVNQLKRVVMHLIANASEAIGEQEGTLTVLTAVRDCDAALLAASRLDIKPPPGRFVALEVRDTGCGMDASVLEKIFDPFFTTKFVGRGLGLPGTLGVMQSHNGAIMVSSQPDKGTTVTVLFPVNPDPPAAPA
jgi:PAS domain S-box-containing protein